MNKLTLSNLLEEANNNISLLQDAIDVDCKKVMRKNRLKMEKVSYIIYSY